jgi:hypothetical protein
MALLMEVTIAAALTLDQQTGVEVALLARVAPLMVANAANHCVCTSAETTH